MPLARNSRPREPRTAALQAEDESNSSKKMASKFQMSSEERGRNLDDDLVNMEIAAEQEFTLGDSVSIRRTTT